MKNITLIACIVIITITLTAFTFSNWNDTHSNKVSCQAAKEIEPPTFSYNLSSRFNNTITKEKIQNAKTISDLIPDNNMQENLKNNIISLKDVEIKIEEENVDQTKQRSEKGNGNDLSEEQIELLKSTDYSTNVILEGSTTHNNLNEKRYFNYYMTVVPEQQSTYKTGNKAFIEYLTTKCQPIIDKVQKGGLKSGMISFTVTKTGTISNIDINSTCGYPSVDKKMLDLINELPNVWNAASNGKGESVNQTLVFFYGQTGC